MICWLTFICNLSCCPSLTGKYNIFGFILRILICPDHIFSRAWKQSCNDNHGFYFLPKSGLSNKSWQNGPLIFLPAEFNLCSLVKISVKWEKKTLYFKDNETRNYIGALQCRKCVTASKYAIMICSIWYQVPVINLQWCPVFCYMVRYLDLLSITLSTIM